MKVAYIYFNIDGYDKPYHSVDQKVDGEYSVHKFTDENFTPRQVMTPRLQTHLHKMFCWQFVPGHDIYIWADAYFAMLRDDAASWIIEQLGDNDIGFFKHPFRDTVKEEADFLRENLDKSKRLMIRYKGEYLEELMKVIPDGPLCASGIIVFRNTYKVQSAFKEWWYYTSRYHIDNQLTIPEAFKDCNLKIIDGDIFNNEYFSYTKGRNE